MNSCRLGKAGRERHPRSLQFRLLLRVTPPKCLSDNAFSTTLGFFHTLQSLFTKCLRLHGLWPSAPLSDRSTRPGQSEQPCQGDGKQSVPGGEGAEHFTSPAVSGETGLVQGIVLERFRAATPSRSPSLGRDPAYLGQGCVASFRKDGSSEENSSPEAYCLRPRCP